MTCQVPGPRRPIWHARGSLEPLISYWNESALMKCESLRNKKNRFFKIGLLSLDLLCLVYFSGFVYCLLFCYFPDRWLGGATFYYRGVMRNMKNGRKTDLGVAKMLIRVENVMLTILCIWLKFCFFFLFWLLCRCCGGSCPANEFAAR